MSHIWMSHVTHMNQSCRTYEWVMSHTKMSCATHMNASCRTYEWVTFQIGISLIAHMNEPCHMYEWVMPHIWMSHAAHMNESCCKYKKVSKMSHVTLMSHTAHMNSQMYVWRYMCDMTHSCVRYGSTLMSRMRVEVEDYNLEALRCRTSEWVMSHIWMSHVAYMNESCRTYEFRHQEISTSCS